MQIAGTAAGILLAGLLFCSSFAQAECLKIASDAKGTQVIEIFKPGIKLAFRKAGICAEFINMPALRAQKAMTLGEIHGEFIRFDAYIKAMHKQVIPVPTPIISGGGFIVTRIDSNFHPTTPAQLKDKKIGIIRGFKWHEVLSAQIREKVKASDYNELGKKLKNGEIDGFFTENISLRRLYKSGILREHEIFKSKPVINLSGYLLLHKNSAQHIKKLNRELRVLKAMGWFNIP